MAENCFLWSTTASDNDDADAAVPWPEGMLPGAVNNAARGLMAGVARYIQDTNGSITTGGSSNAYTVTSKSGHSTLTNGIAIAAKASFTNTAAATLNLNSFGAKKIRVFVNGAEADAAAGQIISGGTYHFRYDTALDSASGAFLLCDGSPDPALFLSTGTIKLWPSDTLESGWAWCNGQQLSQTTYAGLYAILGTTFNTGGETAGFFRVPDLCGRAPFGSDDMGAITLKSRITNVGSSIVGTTLGASGGVESVTLLTSQIPSHTHTGTSDGSTVTGTSDGGGAHTHTGTTNSDGSHTHTISPSGARGAQGGVVSGSAPPTTGIIDIGALSVDAGGAHTHIFTTDSSGAHVHTFTSASHTHTFTTAATGGGALHSNMPPALIVNFAIKT